MRDVKFVRLGHLSFADAWQRQQDALEELRQGRAQETIHLLEHPHTFTIGRSGNGSNLLRSTDFDGVPIQLLRINRGGDVTYHGPGQAVVYPHLDLRLRGRDVHLYLRNLEEVLIRSAAHFGQNAFRRDGLTGVWTQQGKLASIGVGVRHWITLHGLALNVSTDLNYFSLMNPCGLEKCPVTSLSRLLGRSITLDEVFPVLERCFEDVFVVKSIPLEPQFAEPHSERESRLAAAVDRAD